ncbi:MAG: DUF952 domain-containing protein [Rhodospirillales bacterium]
MSKLKPSNLIYHMCQREEWRCAKVVNIYSGSSQDRADGFIHFSTAEQVAASADKHRAGQVGLVLLTVDVNRLGNAVEWELAREGQLFPHLYGPLPVYAVVNVSDLLLGPDCRHVFPAGFRR